MTKNAYLYVVCIVLLLARPIFAQDQPITLSVPDGWELKQDDDATLVVTADDAEVLIWLLDGEETGLESQMSPADVMGVFFDDVDPQPTDDYPEMVSISREDEIIYGLMIDEQYYALAFVTWEKQPPDFALIEQMLNTLAYEHPADPAEATLEAVVEASDGFLAADFILFDLTWTLTYPETWLIQALAEVGFVFTDEDETFALMFIEDLTFVFDLLGAEGNAEQTRTPHDVFAALETSMGHTSDEIETLTIGRYRAERLQLSDEFGDFAVLAFAPDAGQLLTVIFNGQQDELARFNPMIERLIESMEKES